MATVSTVSDEPALSEVVCIFHSTVSRPFPHPVFDCLKYANMEEGRPGRFGHVKVDRGEAHRGWCPIVIVPISC